MKDYIIQCEVEELVEWSSRLNIGIYYKTFEWAQFVYDKLLKYFKDLDCLAHASVEKNGFGFIVLKNGVIYQILRADETSRGYKNNIVYMQDGIDDDIIDTIIEPSIMPYKDLYMVTR